MSNIFITDVIGQNTYAVPTQDSELASATSGFDGLLSTVANLAYDRVLAWVEDAGGPGGAEGNRTLNCLVEKFTYLTKECPSETEVDTMTAAIESTLEADADITSINQQQVHIFQAGAYFLWQRDATGGFLYPNTSTDDVAVGPFASPNGKWFDDGDLVLGGNTMSGAEVLRVIGDQRLEGGLLMVEEAAVPIAPAATEGVFWVKDDSPNVPYFTDDAGTDHELAYAEDAGISLPDVDQVLFVDKASPAPASEDGTMQAPYTTIAAAITAANGLSPTSSNRIGIIIYPGIYDEALTTQDDYVSLIGFDKHTTIVQQSSGTGVPLTMASRNFSVHNITFEVSGTATGNIIVDSTVLSTDPVYFYNCDFLGTAGNSGNYVNSRRPALWFYDCRFIHSDDGSWIYYSTQTNVRESRFYNCEFEGTVETAGNETVKFWSCHFVGSAATGTTFRGTIKLNTNNAKHYFYDCYIENTNASSGVPVYFNAGMTDCGEFHGCTFVSAWDHDMTGQNYAVITVKGCAMSKGMDLYARVVNQVKYAQGSAGDLDYYTSIDDAVDSLLSTQDDNCIIYMLGDFSGDVAVGTSQAMKFTIDGLGHSWTDTNIGQTFATNSNQTVILKNIDFVTSEIRWTGTGATLVMDNCSLTGRIDAVSGGLDTTALCVIHDCSLEGSGTSTYREPIAIRDPDPTIIISQSYVTGASGGYAAVDYNSVVNDNLKIEWSTIMHSSLGSNNPFTGATSQVDYAAHHTCFNVEPDVADSTNYNNIIDLAQRQNTIDADADYGWRKYV